MVDNIKYTEPNTLNPKVYDIQQMMFINIVLMNGCFHIGPVICSRSVIMARGWL